MRPDRSGEVSSRHVRVVPRVCAMVIAAALVSVSAAHTGFESSQPAGEGFVVLDPDLGLREPGTVDRPDVGEFVLHFDPAISPGDVRESNQDLMRRSVSNVR